MRQFVGAAILLLIFGGLFSMTAYEMGLRESVFAWLFALAMTAAIAAGVYLLVS